jgi:multicomponent Na+:H+ antiporter subunit E
MKATVRVLKGVELAFYFLYELVVSSFRVAWEVVTARTYSKPGIIAVPLDVRSDVGITLLANLVSLTPGSLSLEVSPDHRVLYVHVMFIGDADTERDNIKNNFERRVMEVVE